MKLTIGISNPLPMFSDYLRIIYNSVPIIDDNYL